MNENELNECFDKLNVYLQKMFLKCSERTQASKLHTAKTSIERLKKQLKELG